MQSVTLGVKAGTGQLHRIEKPHGFKQGQYEGNRSKRNKVGLGSGKKKWMREPER